MKKLIKTVSILIVFILFVNCNSNDSSENSLENELVGTWNIVTLNSNVALDINQDGVASTSLNNETNCITEELTFNADGTFSRESSFELEFSTALQDVVCSNNSSIGTWSLNDNLLTITISSNANTYTITLTDGVLAYNLLENLSTTNVVGVYALE